MDRRLLLAGAAAVFALGVYLSAELARWRSRGDDPRVLRPGQGGGAGGELSYDQFMTMLGAMSRDPAGASFAAAFGSKPKLRETFRRFSASQDVKALVRELKASEDFKEVLAQESAKPEFRKLVERTLALVPGLSGVLFDATAREGLLEGGGERPGQDRLRLVLAGALRNSWNRPPPLQVGTSRRRVAPGERPWIERPALAASGGSGRRSSRGGGARAGASAVAAGAPARGDAGVGGVQGGGWTARSGAQSGAVTGLAQVNEARSRRSQTLLERYPWIGALNSQERERILEQTDELGLWGACFALGLYDRCRSIARSRDATPQTGWDSCLEYQNGNAGTCAALCPLEAGCSVPESVASATAGGGPEDGGSSGPGRPGSPVTPPKVTPPAIPPVIVDPVDPEPTPPPDPELPPTQPAAEPDPEPPSPPDYQDPGSYRERPQCLAAGTKVRTPAGERDIESLAVGDVVDSVDEFRGRAVAVRVVGLFARGPRRTLRVLLESGRELLATSEHPLFDRSAGRYRAAGELRKGDSLTLPEGGTLRDSRIVTISDGPVVPVYDLTVEGPHHNFLANGVLVHNKSGNVQIE